LHRSPQPGCVEAVVVLAEQLGAEQHVHVRVGENTVVARVAPDADLRIHDVVFVTLAADSLCLFDRATETALEARPGMALA
jgi:ABC-type sugar transport system ATPase subunit